jgi:ribonuclease VapC
MIVDTSAILAIVFGEPEADTFARMIRGADGCAMSAVSFVEAYMNVAGRGGRSAGDDLEAMLERLRVTIAPFDPEQARIAADAFLAYGKGRHPAALNFGDCCAYALAKATGRPLLFKGEDFAQTDIPSALA